MTIQIRPGEHKGKPAFHIVGTNPRGQRLKIATKTRSGAERIRIAENAGHDWSFSDVEKGEEEHETPGSVIPMDLFRDRRATKQ